MILDALRPVAAVETALADIHTLLATGDYAVIEAGVNRLMEQYSANADALHRMAYLLYAKSRIDLAMKVYKAAYRRFPTNPDILNGIAICYMVHGNFDKAGTYWDKAIALAPYNPYYMENITLIKKIKPTSSIAKRLHTLRQSPACSGKDRVVTCFALAKIYEHSGALDRAFQYYSEAHSAQSRIEPYKEANFHAAFGNIEAVFDADFFKKFSLKKPTKPLPVFVLGMPRSGTSLVEQILASHPVVYGAGEIDILAYIAEITIPNDTGRQFPHYAGAMNEESLASYAEFYLKQLRSYGRNNRAYIVDKTPNNFFLIGLIHIMFPGAPIIHCVRDPMDTCWSIMRNTFIGSHSYSHDQATLGRYYRRYKRLMDHWHQLLPGRIHDIHYEELVANPAPAIRALLEYCHLAWDEKCMKFYRTKRDVATASASQVRRPLYTDSLQSWQPLAQELAPLQQALYSAA